MHGKEHVAPTSQSNAMRESHQLRARCPRGAMPHGCLDGKSCHCLCIWSILKVIAGLDEGKSSSQRLCLLNTPTLIASSRGCCGASTSGSDNVKLPVSGLLVLNVSGGETCCESSIARDMFLKTYSTLAVT
mmetsp:Transcript_114602/g.228072  ORF Transcript_114602/g.228072 Transcript_114602/m.228072 type:complete len:131 (+) Transcript_114602:98-490(+)